MTFNADKGGHQGTGLGRLLVQFILAVHLTRDFLDVDLGYSLFLDPYSAASIAGR
jgi:hypothetical protein